MKQIQAKAKERTSIFHLQRNQKEDYKAFNTLTSALNGQQQQQQTSRGVIKFKTHNASKSKLSHEELIDIPEQLIQKKSAKANKLMEKQMVKEGTSKERSHSIRLQESQAKVKSRSHIPFMGESSHVNQSQEGEGTLRMPGLIMSQLQNDFDDGPSVNLNDPNRIEDEHHKIHIHESFQKSASGYAFEKQAKLRFNQIDEEQSQMDEDEELQVLKLGTLRRIVGTELQIEISEEDHQPEEESVSESAEYISEFKELYRQDAYKDHYSLELLISHDFDWLFKEVTYYSDPHPLLYLRKFIFFITNLFYVICYHITQSSYFDYYEISVTISNVALFLVDNDRNSTQVYSYQYMFLSMYFADFCIQLGGRGWRVFFKDLWNFYDFFILIIYALFVLDRKLMPFDVSTFRVIRIPFYLSRFNNNLKIMIVSLQSSFKHILETLLVLILFSLILSLFALNLFHGTMKYRCMNAETGIFSTTPYEEDVCGYADCKEEGFICAKTVNNIEVPSSYDTMQYSYTQIIRTTIINDWTITMYMLMLQFHPLTCLYYIFIILILDKFCFQLVIAVLKTYYHHNSEYYDKHQIVPEWFEDQARINLKALHNLQLWQQLKQATIMYKLNPDLLKKEHLDSSHSYSLGSLRDLMENQVAHGDIGDQKAQDTKLLSARQSNELDNFKNKQRKKYSLDSWINRLLPNQSLQQYQIAKIDKKEETFLYLYDLELFFRFRTCDFLSLKVGVKKTKYISESQADIFPPNPINYDEMYKSHLKREYIVDELCIKEDVPKKIVNLPLRKRAYPSQHSFSSNNSDFVVLDNSNAEHSARLHKELDSEQASPLMRKPLTGKSFLKHATFVQQKRETFDQSIFLAREYVEPHITQIGRNQQIIVEGRSQNYKEISALINQEFDEPNTLDEDIRQIHYEIKSLDRKMNRIVLFNWSGSEVLNKIRYIQLFHILSKLNEGLDLEYWRYLINTIDCLRFYVLLFVTYPLTVIIMDFFVCINTILLASDGYIDSNVSFYSDIILNIMLFIELLMKAFTLNRYFRHTTNILEAVVIIVSTSEKFMSILIINPSFAISNIMIYLRVLKAFLFLRVIKYNNFASNMITISFQTFPSYANLSLMLFFLLLNYALFGMYMFRDLFPHEDVLNLLHYYGTAYQSWIAVFDISTGDDWYGVVILSYTFSNQTIAFIYCISFVLIVFYLTYGLLLAIVLDGFNKYLNDMEQLNQENEQEEDEKNNKKQNNYEQKQEDDNENNKHDSQNEAVTSKALHATKDLHGSKEIIDDTRESKNLPHIKKEDFQMKHVIESLIKPNNEEKYFQEVKNRQTLFYFDKSNQVRRFLYSVINQIGYKIFMQIVTWGSLINLIIQTYYDHEQSSVVVPIIQTICNIIVLLDALMQMIVFGSTDEQGYFNGIWVTIDFIYVITYFISFLSNHQVIHGMLFMGYLRPLKVVSYAGLFKNERDAIFYCLKDIISTAYVVFLFWFIFAIFGMTIYKDKMGYCDNYTNLGVSQQACTGQWMIFPFNFDTIVRAMESLFVISTFDTWCQILYICINSNVASEGPQRFANEWPSYIFFVLFIFVGSLFLLFFFAGIIFINFKQKKSQLLNPDLTLNQELFIKISQTIMKEVTNYSDPPKKGIRLHAKGILNNKYYIYSYRFGLFLNLFALMLFTEDGSTTFLQVLNIIHHINSLFLTIDLFLKLLTYHIKRYFGDAWRQLEFGFFIFSIVDFSLDIKYSWFITYARAIRSEPLYIYLRLFSFFRDLRMILIIQLFNQIRRLLNVIGFNIMTIIRILGLFLTVFTCYSYIGCALYGDIEHGQYINEQLGFANFFYGMLTLFKVQTKNGWRFILTDSTNYNPYCKSKGICGKDWNLAITFYFTFVMISSHVLMNLIVCELVDEFERFYGSSSNVIEAYIENIDKFRNIWCKYTLEYRGQKMHTKFLAAFLLELGEPFGAQKGDNVWDAAKHASSFQLKSVDSCVSFKGLLYECVKLCYRPDFKEGTFQGLQIMKAHDRKIRYRLYNLRHWSQRRQVANNYVDLYANFNILQEYLYLFMALKAWKAYGQNFFEKAGSAETVIFSERDIQPKPYQYGNNNLNDAENEINSDPEIEQLDQIKRYPTQENLRRPTDVYILQMYEQAPKFRLKISYLDRIFQSKVKHNIIFKPQTDQKAKKKDIPTIMKKQQHIKIDEHRKHAQEHDMPQISKMRYAYGYHDKMPQIIQSTYPTNDDQLERGASQLNVVRMQSNMDIQKKRSVKFK